MGTLSHQMVAGEPSGLFTKNTSDKAPRESLVPRHSVHVQIHQPVSEISTSSSLSLLRHARRLLPRSTFSPQPSTTRKGTSLGQMSCDTEQFLATLGRHREDPSYKVTQVAESHSPCQRLPPELWSRIFQYCLPEGETYVRPDVMGAPLLMCRVCRLWREVAISTPSIWSSLSIHRNLRKRPHAYLLQAWVQRSQAVPLSLEVYLSAPSNQPCHFHHDHSILQVVISCAERWQNLRLNVTNDCLLQSIFDRPMPSLQTIELSSNCAIGQLAICPTLAPQLRTVSLLTAPLDFRPLSLPWSALNRLSSRHWAEVDSHLEVLRRCPNLEFARLHLLQAHHPRTSGCPPLLLEKVRILEIAALNGCAMSVILDRLVLPSVSELHLDVPGESPEYGVSGWPKDSVVSLVERSRIPSLMVCLKGIDVLVTKDRIVFS